MDKWTKYGQTNRWNYTNFEWNLAMMMIYVPVKYEFDWTNRFRVRVRKQKMSTDVRHTNLIGGLVTRNPPKNEFAYFSSIVAKKAFLDFKVAFKLTWVAAKT